jgi:Tol biopolymer transport system component
MKTTALILTAVLMAAIAWIPAATQDRQALFEKALALEEAQGKLQEAIALYQKIVDESKAPSLAAQAQLRIGICHQKLGHKEAQSAFQKVIDNYPGQAEAVRQAREQLSVLARTQTLIEKSDGDLRIRKVPELIGGWISRDGRWLCGWDDTGDLSIMEVATGSKRRLTQGASWDKGDFVDDLAISPDSKRVAFVWFRDYRNRDLKVVNIDGTGERTLRTDADASGQLRLCDWTPDGRHILGITSQVRLKESEASRFVLFSVSDGAIQEVKSLGGPRPQRINISPDGRWIAYDFAQNDATGERDIFLVSADGSREIPLVQHPADDRLLGWAPGGEQILFSSDRLESGSLDMWIVPVGNGKARGAPALVRRYAGRRDIEPMGFTQDGAFYYTDFSGKSDVYLAVLDPEKAKVSTPAQNIAQGFEGANRDPAWSPDGKYLAYISDRESGGPKSLALCILSLDTGEYRVLFPELKSMARMTWFADGESVLVMGGESGGLRLVAGKTGGVGVVNWGSIDLINVKTAAVRTLIADDGTGIHSPRCTPDGKKILYGNDSWQERVFRIVSYDVESGQKKEICRSSQPIVRMDIAPDGKLLAFLDPADASLRIMPTEGGSPRVLYKLDSMIRGPAWSPDGKNIYFARYIKGTQRQELWRIPSAGGEPVRFDLAVDGSMENFDIHPDGRRIAYQSTRYARDVWVMENFLPKRK